jgi:hypothetical protein
MAAQTIPFPRARVNQLSPQPVFVVPFQSNFSDTGSRNPAETFGTIARE